MRITNNLSYKSDSIQQLKNCLSNLKLYSINYAKVKKQFLQEIENYKNFPHLVSIDEFSMNYAFGYHLYHNIEDARSKEAMFIELKNYLSSLNLAA